MGNFSAHTTRTRRTPLAAGARGAPSPLHRAGTTPRASVLLVVPFATLVGCLGPTTKTACGEVPGLVSPLGEAQPELEGALRPLTLEPATGRLDATSVGALPPWFASPTTRVIALGEATHGTREINEARAALALELAGGSKDAIVFLLEDEFVRGAAVDEFLAGKGADAAAALNGLRAGVWKNRELAALLERLRALNAREGSPRIVFRGIDMQDSAAIQDGLARSAGALGVDVTPELATFRGDFERYVAAFQQLVDAFDTQAVVDYAPTAALRAKLLADLAQLRARFEQAPAQGRSPRDRALHLLTVRVAEQNVVKADPLANVMMLLEGDQGARAWVDRIVATVGVDRLAPRPSEVRDRAMAENVEALVALEGEDARGILWAHNGHAARAPVNGETVMGGSLRERMGERYRVIGTEFYAGTFRSASPDGRPGVFKLESSPASFFANAAARLCRPMGIIDLGASGPSLARALAEPTDVHFIGAVYSPDYAPTRVKLSEAFDALVFIRDTTASVPLAP